MPKKSGTPKGEKDTRTWDDSPHKQNKSTNWIRKRFKVPYEARPAPIIPDVNMPAQWKGRRVIECLRYKHYQPGGATIPFAVRLEPLGDEKEGPLLNTVIIFREGVNDVFVSAKSPSSLLTALDRVAPVPTQEGEANVAATPNQAIAEQWGLAMQIEANLPDRFWERGGFRGFTEACGTKFSHTGRWASSEIAKGADRLKRFFTSALPLLMLATLMFDDWTNRIGERALGIVVTGLHFAKGVYEWKTYSIGHVQLGSLHATAETLKALIMQTLAEYGLVRNGVSTVTRFVADTWLGNAATIRLMVADGLACATYHGCMMHILNLIFKRVIGEGHISAGLAAFFYALGVLGHSTIFEAQASQAKKEGRIPFSRILSYAETRVLSLYESMQRFFELREIIEKFWVGFSTGDWERAEQAVENDQKALDAIVPLATEELVVAIEQTELAPDLKQVSADMTGINEQLDVSLVADDVLIAAIGTYSQTDDPLHKKPDANRESWRKGRLPEIIWPLLEKVMLPVAEVLNQAVLSLESNAFGTASLIIYWIHKIQAVFEDIARPAVIKVLAKQGLTEIEVLSISALLGWRRGMKEVFAAQFTRKTFGPTFWNDILLAAVTNPAITKQHLGPFWSDATKLLEVQWMDGVRAKAPIGSQATTPKVGGTSRASVRVSEFELFMTHHSGQQYISDEGGDGMVRVDPEHFELIGWVNANLSNLPIITQICLRVNSIGATSAPVERGFAGAGDVLGPKRMAMTQENQVAHVLLRQNIQLMIETLSATGDWIPKAWNEGPPA
jgi:hypothetical protein